MVGHALIQRLVYAKYIYWQGCETLDKRLPVSLGLSILNFQDSAEMVLRIIAEHVQANIKEKTAFDQLLDEIERARKNEIRIPYRSSIVQLNKARVGFKHFGLAPSADDAQKFRRDLYLFFQACIKAFLDIDFFQITLSDLIRKQRVKNFLKEAERKLDTDNYDECIVKAAIAFSLIFRRRLGSRDVMRLERIRVDYNVGRSLGNLPKLVDTLCAAVKNHEEELSLLMYGINLAEYERFIGIVPNIGLSSLGDVMQVVYTHPKKDTLEDALFCLRFVVDAALLVQQNRVPDRWEDYYKKNLPVYRIIEKAPILISPKSERPEVIREAEVGEVLIGYFEGYNIADYAAVLQDDDLAYIRSTAVEELQKDKFPPSPEQ